MYLRVLCGGFVFSRPKCPVQGSILDRFGDVLGLNSLLAFEIGNGPPHLEDSVVGAGGEPLLRHRAFEQAFAISRQFAERANLSRCHLRIAIRPWGIGGLCGAGALARVRGLGCTLPDLRSRESPQLDFSCAHNSLANLA